MTLPYLSGLPQGSIRYLITQAHIAVSSLSPQTLGLEYLLSTYFLVTTLGGVIRAETRADQATLGIRGYDIRQNSPRDQTDYQRGPGVAAAHAASLRAKE